MENITITLIWSDISFVFNDKLTRPETLIRVIKKEENLKERKLCPLVDGAPNLV